MERIVFLDRDSILADIRRPVFPHEWRDYPTTPASQVSERLNGATIAISNKVPLMAASLTPLKDLKMIAVCATGTNNVDLDHCHEYPSLCDPLRAGTCFHDDTGPATQSSGLSRRCRQRTVAEGRAVLPVHPPHLGFARQRAGCGRSRNTGPSHGETG